MEERVSELKRVVVYIPQDLHWNLKATLVLRGETVSNWFREKALEETGSKILEKNSVTVKEAFNDVEFAQ